MRLVITFCACAFAIGGVGMLAASRNVDAPRRRERWIKYASYFAILTTVLAVAASGRLPFTTMMLALLAGGARELSKLVERRDRAVWCVYLALAAGLLAFAWIARAEQAIFIYLLVAIFDGFSQVSGQLFGKRHFAPTISPAKSVEGAIGGAIAAASGAILLRSLIDVTTGRALLICSVVITAALAGDLAASWVKRRAHAKDFGTLLPGHGGILDRFDSFLLAAPVAILFLN